MDDNEMYLYLLAVQREFFWLCQKTGATIPQISADSMVETLHETIRQYQVLWDSCH
jgi:hypothetical protein